MSSASNNPVEYYPPIASLRCKCGEPLKVMTSTTAENPGRRFGFCNMLEGGCDVWRWLEPDDVSAKAKAIIKKCKLRITALEDELSRVKVREQPMTSKLAETVWAFEEMKKMNAGLMEKNDNLELKSAKACGAMAIRF